jgi:hypothetical protein
VDDLDNPMTQRTLNATLPSYVVRSPTIGIMENGVEATSKTAIGVSFPLLLMTGSLAVLWPLLEVLQLLYFLKFINVDTPPMIDDLWKLFKFSTLNFIPNLGQIFVDHLNIDLDSSNDRFIPAKFSQENLQAVFLIDGSRMLSSILGAIMAWALIKLLFSLLFQDYSRNFLVKVLTKLKQDVEYNSIIRVYLNAQLELALASALNLRAILFRNWFLVASVVSAVAFIPLLAVMPFAFMTFLNQQNTQLREDPSMKRKFGLSLKS